MEEIKKEKASALSVIALVVGIAALFCFFVLVMCWLGLPTPHTALTVIGIVLIASIPLGIAALVLGFIALDKVTSQKPVRRKTRTFSILAMCFGASVIIGMIVISILAKA